MDERISVPDDIKNGLRVGDDANIQRLLKRIIKFFHKVSRPTFIGPISVDLGISIRQLQLLIDVLVDNQLIRKAYLDELHNMGLSPDSGSVVYVLTSRAEVRLAHD